MCGIFGYIGKKNPLKACLKGLELLEYRGYDSSGIAGIVAGKIESCKEIGKLSCLKEKLTLKALEVAIGHTRWATHGKVTNQNAHPQFDSKQSIALVHNGIIENFDEIRTRLEKNGIVFSSETDTEVITQLISSNYEGNLADAVHRSLPFLKGHFAIALIHKDHPDLIIAAARECPLSIGTDDKCTESIVSSDPNAFLGKAFNITFLRNDEIAKIQKGKIEVFDSNFKLILKKTERLESASKAPTKEGFKHFMLKEIFEQPTTIQKAFLGRIEEQQVRFEELKHELKNVKSVLFIGCGTSAHAGAIGSLFLEDLAHIPAHYEISSEARFRVIPPETLVVAMSQSGETADTLSAIREIRAKGIKVLGICNVKNSTLTREADHCIFLKAGPEMSVCSTKAFTSQITVLYLLAQYLAQNKNLDELKQIPAHVQKVLDQAPLIQKIAQKYCHYSNFFFMGRRYMYPTCMEAALKLKEISYVNANGYPAGEIKHGPIALIDTNFPVIAFCSNKQTEDKILSNLQELKARGAPILALAPEHLTSVTKIADDVIWLPQSSDLLSPFASTIAGQLLAYYIALSRGCDIDQPRNLAKSVTVE
ncbi:MAG: glutamine--fructose-6-phosphate transaminase (isomerizing) [Chlamydiae bacterium CG10_big_fil_rev_8_21_14_0_10_42_34]|nr:MAG: glutamine--fructose-6-phosphate transaminase (isomerizing) [Chlamydiae bacterium CG10_big_fil_rev_8_21_14_0_10_42_34]